MHPLTATQAIKPALNRTREVVAYPFEWRRFVLVCLIAVYALPGVDLPPLFTRKMNAANVGYANQFSNFHFTPLTRDLLIAFAVSAGFALVVLVLSTAFRLPFVIFDVMSGRSSNYRDSWKENGSRAWQLFGFSICAGIAGSIVSSLLHTIVRASHLDGSPFEKLIVGAVPATVEILFYWIVSDLLVPLLVLNGGTCTEALLYALKLISKMPADFFRYFLIKFCLAALVSVFFTALSFVFSSIVLRPTMPLVINLLRSNTVSGVTSLSIPIVLAATAAIAVLLMLVLLHFLISGPIAAFFEAYSIFFLAGRFAPLEELIQSVSVPPSLGGSLPGDPAVA